jgi:predicted ATPase
MKSNYDRICKIVHDLPEFQSTNWFIITGPPCSGKTTLINELSNLGYAINPDISREYLENKVKKGISAITARVNEKVFQRTIFILMIKNALLLDKTKLIFNDYFLPDNLPFLELSNINIPLEYIKSSRLFLFKKVFICSPLTLEKDNIRIESISDQTSLFKFILKTYSDIGSDIVVLPPISIESRMQIILDNLK